MNFNIEFKNFTPQKEAQRLIQELIGKIEKKAKAFSPDARYLRLMVEENSARKLYHASITLTLPEKTLATKKSATICAAMRDAFAEIEQPAPSRIKPPYAASILWKRRTRREELRKGT